LLVHYRPSISYRGEVDAVILYPVQTATNLLAYETGYYSAVDVRRLGIGMLVLTVIVILLAIPYWNALSLPLSF
jgi:solute carrier family 13 (sodium-dependent dicarboxylate transporter), member 2/3/5